MKLEDKLLQNTVTDLSGFQSLKNSAKNNDPEAAKTVAKQFEALFIQMMLKSMRDATDAISFGDSLLDNDEQKLFTELFDKQVSLDMANGQGIGLAKLIEQELLKSMGSAEKPDMPEINKNIIPNISVINRAEIAPIKENNLQDSFNKEKISFSSPEEFVNKIMPIAKEYAKKIGVKPEILVAQAALETGWGKTLSGGSSEKAINNLFGIKATPDWKGSVAMKNTLEFENGTILKKTEPFRIYETLKESFDDYVSFLKGNHRYQDALKKSNNPEAFAQALQDAGYATDPDYAKKILKIYDKIG